MLNPEVFLPSLFKTRRSVFDISVVYMLNLMTLRKAPFLFTIFSDNL